MTDGKELNKPEGFKLLCSGPDLDLQTDADKIEEPNSDLSGEVFFPELNRRTAYCCSRFL
jgi:hypothetical protein